MANEVFKSSTLDAVNDFLLEQTGPVPVVHVKTKSDDGGRLRKVWLGYGKTKPTERLDAARGKIDGKELFGLVIPIDPTTKATAHNFSNPYEGMEEASPEGWWQGWTADRTYHVVNGEEVAEHALDASRNWGGYIAATWISRRAISHEPQVLFDAADSDVILNNASPYAANRINEEFIAVGGNAAQLALLLAGASAPNIPLPIQDMVSTVAEQLDVTLQ